MQSSGLFLIIHRMNQLKRLSLILGMGAIGFLSPLGHGAVILDDFNQYTGGAGNTIQKQNPAWRTIGNAADGIYSVPKGNNGTPGASVVMNFTSANNNGSFRYTFATPQVLTKEVTFTLDIAVSAILPNTTLVAQISDSSNTTIYQLSTPVTFTSEGFQTYTFTLNASTMTRVDGKLSFDDVLKDLTNLTFRFVNATDAGRQEIFFDNLTMITTIPEPSVAAIGLAGGVGALALSRWRRRTSRL